MRLNLGCSDAHVPGYVNVDICPPCDQVVDLRERWTWADSSIEYIRAHDIIEHLPSKIHTMNEAYRVLQHGGKFEIVVPTTEGRGAFQDPTHVSYWTPNDLYYYTHLDPHRERFGKAYGVVARFRVLSKEHKGYPDSVWKLHAMLQAVK
jgi:predicted SAM-dependent methyltransferase